MAEYNFNPEIEEELLDENLINEEELFENTTMSSSNKKKTKRKWREIEAIKERQRLRLELQDLEDYELGFSVKKSRLKRLFYFLKNLNFYYSNF